MTNEKISIDKTEQLLIAIALTKYAEEFVEGGPSKSNVRMIKSICDLLDRMGYHNQANTAYALLYADFDPSDRG